MSLRASVYHGSLHRPRLYAGVPKEAFMVIALGLSYCFVAQLYALMPGAALLWLLARWLTRREPLWFELLRVYLAEAHVYDSLPRIGVAWRRAPGWGRGLPC